MRPIHPALPLTLILVLSPLTGLDADEGWSIGSRVAGGALYSDVDHPDIALEKEVLLYRPTGQVEAHFLFRNTSQELVRVDVGFPVLAVNPRLGRDIHYKYGDDPESVTRQLQAESGVDFGDLVSSPVEEWSMSISQDRRPVTIDSVRVGAETTRKCTILHRYRVLLVEGQEADADSLWYQFVEVTADDTVRTRAREPARHAHLAEQGWIDSPIIQGGELSVHYHFMHQLAFPAASQSTVVVRYSGISWLNEDYTGIDYYTWHYILGTGRTWKGPIGVLYLLVPHYLRPALPAAFSRAGRYGEHGMYVARDYEPAADDTIAVDYGIDDLNPDTSPLFEVNPPAAPAQPFVRVVGASTSLTQTTWVTDILDRALAAEDTVTSFGRVSDYFRGSFLVDMGARIDGIGFGPLSLFDGLPSSAWCEGAKGDGVGEWVEFELAEEVLGVAVANGFRKLGLIPTEYSYTGHEEELARLKGTYAANGRPRVLELVSADSAVRYELELEDQPEGGAPHWQTFGNVRLPAGTYRAYIRDVYPGSRWHDTCLGELEFRPAKSARLVEADEFLRSVLHHQ